ncbi:MAG: hypothetical protein D6690_13775 [Nitrospirae bacterium]|nr:MAG: hypothetical protein D6690_13775 [Nitrospirota bacterium]
MEMVGVRIDPLHSRNHTALSTDLRTSDRTRTDAPRNPPYDWTTFWKDRSLPSMLWLMLREMAL